MKKLYKTPLAVTMGTAVISILTATSVNAETNPFAVSELSEGYMQVAQADTSYSVKPWGEEKAKKEAACGEGKCGGMMNGDKMKKGMESSCGAMMKGKEGACGEMDKAAKSGESKCGSMMKGKMKDKMKGGEMSCGGMMKGGEGMCGERMEKMKGMMGGDMDMKGGEMSCGSKMKK